MTKARNRVSSISWVFLWREKSMVRIREGLTVGAVTWVVLLSLVCQPALGRDVKLVIHPQKVSAEVGKYSLLPPQASLTDGDAPSLYENAVKALPADDTEWNDIYEWLAMPLDQLPLEEVQAALEHQKESLDAVARAARCRECKWTKRTTRAVMANDAEYRRLGSIIRLRTRYELAKGNWEGAIHAMQTGFGMAKHLAQAPAVIQFIVGVGVARLMHAEVEEFVQRKDTPNLYAALAALPRPFADPEKAIENDPKPASSRLSRALGGKQAESELKAAYDTVRASARRLDGGLAALQCIEAIRSYTASHGGQLPQTLAEITELSVPTDPVSGEAFRYTRTGSTAVLESAAPAGGEEEDRLGYEIVLKE